MQCDRLKCDVHCVESYAEEDVCVRDGIHSCSCHQNNINITHCIKC